MTSATSYRRLIDVETTSCVYWVRMQSGVNTTIDDEITLIDKHQINARGRV